jgi:DNA-binding MarR family transcriptional regulator
MKYSIVKDLLQKLEEYERSYTGKVGTLNEFALWLISSPSTKLTKNASEFDAEIAMLIGFMSKYAAFYTRKLFKTSIFTTIDDYTMLLTLIDGNPVSKTQLIKRVLLEKPTGTVIINRLLKRKLIDEMLSPDDKKARLVRITPFGFNALEEFRDRINTLATHVTGNLTRKEKTELMRILAKLNVFHRPYFDNNARDIKEVF